MSKSDGGPAFPTERAQKLLSASGAVEHIIMGEHGMSLRDWFAGMALAPIMRGMYEALNSDIARQAYLLADAMLVEREK